MKQDWTEPLTPSSELLVKHCPAPHGLSVLLKEHLPSLISLKCHFTFYRKCIFMLHEDNKPQMCCFLSSSGLVVFWFFPFFP